MSTAAPVGNAVYWPATETDHFVYQLGPAMRPPRELREACFPVYDVVARASSGAVEGRGAIVNLLICT